MSDKGEGLVERRVEVITNAILHLPIRGKELEFAARQVDLALRPLDADSIEALSAKLKLAEAALEKISSPTQTESLLWWQTEARSALHSIRED